MSTSIFFLYERVRKVEVIRLANTFSKRVYYIEGLNIMVGEIDSIEKYNEMMSIGMIYDNLEDSVKAVLKKIDLYTETNEAMIDEFKHGLQDEVLDFRMSIQYLTSIKHLREQLEDYKEKRSYYSNLL